MRFTPSIFGKLLEAINRRQFQTIVDRHDGDAYDKSFKSWDHLVALIFAQFSAADSLRGLEAGWNANSQHHYHLASGPIVRSTPGLRRGRLCRTPTSGAPSRSLPRPSHWWRASSTGRRAVMAWRCCA